MFAQKLSQDHREVQCMLQPGYKLLLLVPHLGLLSFAHYYLIYHHHFTIFSFCEVKVISFIFFSFYYELEVLSTYAKMTSLTRWHSTWALAWLALSHIAQSHPPRVVTMSYMWARCILQGAREALEQTGFVCELTMQEFNLQMWCILMLVRCI